MRLVEEPGDAKEQSAFFAGKLIVTCLQTDRPAFWFQHKLANMRGQAQGLAAKAEALGDDVGSIAFALGEIVQEREVEILAAL